MVSFLVVMGVVQGACRSHSLLYLSAGSRDKMAAGFRGGDAAAQLKHALFRLRGAERDRGFRGGDVAAQLLN
jgi:hypothetical protein